MKNKTVASTVVWIAGVMVTVPSLAAPPDTPLATTGYVGKIVEAIKIPDGTNPLIGPDMKISNIYLDSEILGSSITGFIATGSGSYVLIGSAVGGPFGARAIADVLAENISVQGSQISGYGYAGGNGAQIILAGSNATNTGTFGYIDFKDLVTGFGIGSAIYQSLTNGVANTGSSFGSYISSYIQGSLMSGIRGSIISGILGSNVSFYSTGIAWASGSSAGGPLYFDVGGSQTLQYLGSNNTGSGFLYKNTGINGSGYWMPGSQIGSYIAGSSVTGYTMYPTGSVPAGLVSGVAYLPVFYNGAIVGIPFAEFREVMNTALPVVEAP